MATVIRAGIATLFCVLCAWIATLAAVGMAVLFGVPGDWVAVLVSPAVAGLVGLAFGYSWGWASAGTWHRGLGRMHERLDRVLERP